MDILKAAVDWARAEVFSSVFFIVFGLAFVAAGIGFWQLGKTEIARAYIFPSLVAATLLLAAGLGLFFTNQGRVTNFPAQYEANPTAFVRTEVARAEKVMGEYELAIFKIIPVIIVVAALLTVFVDAPLWRAIGITTIALMAVTMLIDSNANARVIEYHEQLMQV
ncbi:hypothetical protein GGR28_000585 [Lewinella aquimaris]|uniref:Uncharacterized protein n=1 Tax=Neolewinella aquimaris TaxID=1835722 RepID=A0A840DXP9_9BACT|nr:hypothetical protein [Neolewinella aquimaris]MBB4077984.1 hypothetical protein [Neolewinella aquimaris]